MSKNVLMIVTSLSRIAATGAPTGIWLEELAAAHNLFRDAGCRVEILSIAGGAAPLDPASLEAPWITASGRRFLADSAAMAQLGATAAVAQAPQTGIDVLYLVGGAGTAWDFPDNEALAALVERVDRAGGIVSAICHGVLGLATARADDGRAFVAGRRVTGVSNAEEKIVGLDQVVPLLPQDTMCRLGAHYSCATEPFGAHIVGDGRLLTGQNPASAGPLAAAIVEVMAGGWQSAGRFGDSGAITKPT